MLQFFKIPFNNVRYTHVRTIRQKVFVEEQHVKISDEYDAYEHDATHYLLTHNSLPIGVARSRETNDGIKLERFAIIDEFRGMGFGKKLLEEILNHVDVEDNEIYLHAQVPVVSFYSKRGFKKVGKRFSEAGIDHYKMVLNFHNPVEDII